MFKILMIVKILERDFTKFCGLLRIFELYSVDSIKRTVLLKVLLLKKNFKKSLLKVLFTISKQYF